MQSINGRNIRYTRWTCQYTAPGSSTVTDQHEGTRCRRHGGPPGEDTDSRCGISAGDRPAGSAVRLITARRVPPNNRQHIRPAPAASMAGTAHAATGRVLSGPLSGPLSGAILSSTRGQFQSSGGGRYFEMGGGGKATYQETVL